VFGGSGSGKKFNDLWSFNIENKKYLSNYLDGARSSRMEHGLLPGKDTPVPLSETITS